MLLLMLMSLTLMLHHFGAGFTVRICFFSIIMMISTVTIIVTVIVYGLRCDHLLALALGDLYNFQDVKCFHSRYQHRMLIVVDHLP